MFGSFFNFVYAFLTFKSDITSDPTAVPYFKYLSVTLSLPIVKTRDSNSARAPNRRFVGSAKVNNLS
ncbi:hypothetical protein D3C71_1281140 [compost metagenome]